MLVLKSVAASVAGAVVGFVLVVVAGYPLFLAAAGGRDMNGGIAMGVVGGLAPLGAVIGAVVGVVLVLMLNRKRAEDAPDSRFKARNWLIAGGVLVVGYFGLLKVLHGPAKIPFDQQPDIHFEIRTTAASIGKQENFKPHGELYDHYTKKAIAIPLKLSINGGASVVSGAYRIVGGLERNRLRVHLASDLTIFATVPVHTGGGRAPGFSKWMTVDDIANPQTGKSELGFSQKTHMYRYQVIARQ